MIHADHAATTPIDPRLLDQLAEDLRRPLNASSVHRAGQEARRMLEQCREECAALLGVADPADVAFTSGATEAANLALRGFAASLPRPIRVLSSPIEHACVRDTIEALARAGRAEIAPLAVGGDGRVVVPDAQPDGADLLCLMAVNNETGTEQDLAAAGALRRAPGRMLWLCDAAQAVGRIPVDAAAWGADWIIASGHKIGAPAGVGLLAGPGLRRIVPQATGGPQENELRAGTEPLALVRAFAAALRFAVEERAERAARMAACAEALLAALDGLGVPYRVNGAHRAAGFANIALPGLEAMDVVIALDQAGVAASPGSACSTGVVSASPVLAAMYPDDAERAAGGVRFSFGPGNTPDEARAIAGRLVEIWARRRA